MKNLGILTDAELKDYLKQKKSKLNNLTTIKKVIWVYPVVDKPYCVELIELLDGSIVADIRHESVYLKIKNRKC